MPSWKKLISSGSNAHLNAVTASSDIVISQDSKKLMLGAGNDLQIYHDGSNNYIDSTTSDQDLYIRGNDGGSMITAARFDMSDAGTLLPGNNLRMGDSKKIRLGTANDFNLYHDGSDSYIYNESSAGKIIIQNTTSDGDIEIKVSDGGSTTNAIVIDASDNSRVKLPNDNQRLSIGASNDIQITHDGSNSYFDNYTGHLNIKNNATDKDIILLSDDGSGGETAYITLDGSITKTTLQKDISGSLGTTGSFDRLEANTLNATISPFASGSDVSQIQAQTGSYASGSDLHQFLAESASYLVDADTGSLGLLTLGNNITGSITSTGSFGRINAADKVFVDGRLGIGTELPAREFNVVSTQQVTSEFTSTNALGNLIDLVHENSAEGHNGFRFYDEGTQRMGLLHVQNGTRGYIHISNTYISGSEIFAVDGDNQNVIIGNHASKDEKLFVDGNVGMTGDLNVSGSITANEYIVNSSVTNVTQSFSSGSTIFGDSIDDTHKFTGSIELTGSTTIDGDESAINLTTDGIKKWQIVKNSDDDFKINRFGGGDDGSFVDQPFSISSGSGITTIN